MTVLITGGSKCGKSRLAESLLGDFSGRKIYLATMQPFGSEAEAAISRHRIQRAGKGYETIEQYTNLDSLRIPEQAAVLLECMGNLLANEMFSDDVADDPCAAVLRGIRHLQTNAAHLIIVTNQVGSDGITYPAETERYIRNLGTVNAACAAASDLVVECVYGIPVVLKGELPCCIR